MNTLSLKHRGDYDQVQATLRDETVFATATLLHSRRRMKGVYDSVAVDSFQAFHSITADNSENSGSANFVSFVG